MRKTTPPRVPLVVRDLVRGQALLRINGGRRHDPVVETWLHDATVPLRPLAEHWFGQLRQCGNDVLELMHDGCPVACVADVPFAYVNTFRQHVSVGFFLGADLPDPAGLLEGSGKRMRHVKLRADRDVDAAALQQLINSAYAAVQQRLRD